MQTIQQTLNPAYLNDIKSQSFLAKFITWCNGQEKFRFGWLAVIITSHGCILTPLTVMAIIFGGNNFFLWGIAIAAMAMSLVTNLAAMPTKITIPVFFLSIVLDIIIIGISIGSLL
ncbi:MAG: hypothetical protein ACSLE0_04425 [Chitinophagaceae bacterium]